MCLDIGIYVLNLHSRFIMDSRYRYREPNINIEQALTFIRLSETSNSLVAGQDINFSFIIPGLFLRINSCRFDIQDGHGKPDRRHRNGMSPSRRR
jgi:hypothetical protein